MPYVCFVRFILAFLLMYVLIPHLLFKRQVVEDMLECFWANLTRMVLLVIITGYLLVIIKLYELISFVAVIAGMLFWHKFARLPQRQKNDLIDAFNSFLYDLADGILHPVGIMRAALAKWRTKAVALAGRCWKDAGCRLKVFSLLAVMGASAYLRFHDSFTRLAPSMSDAYVTLAWMKYIERQELFHDGIYPHGFHIYLSVLHKFAAIDPLFVLNFAGPLNSLMIIAGIYFFASRLTGAPTAGLMAAFVYGLLGKCLPNDYIRQAATNSQEFGMVFVLPGIWFAVLYIRTGNRRHLFNTAAALAVTGLVHTMAALFLAAGLAAVIASGLLLRNLSLTGLTRLCPALGAAALLSILPALVGLAMGKPFHSSSTQFALTKGAPAPEMGLFVIAALAGALVYLVVVLIWVKDKNLRVAALSGLLLTLCHAAIYQAPRFGVDNIALAARSADFISLAIPLGISLPFAFLSTRLFEKGPGLFFAASVLASTMIASLILWPPVIVKPYKMQSEASMRQYFRINQEYRPTEWLIVSQEEGYALVLGRGWHLMTGDFITRCLPDKEKIIDIGTGEFLEHEHIFIFHEKNVFAPEHIKEEILARRLVEEKELEKWIQTYCLYHTDCEVYYEDDDLAVYVIHQIKSNKEKFEELWGENKK